MLFVSVLARGGGGPGTYVVARTLERGVGDGPAPAVVPAHFICNPATGLQLDPQAEISRGWILCHKVTPPSTSHAGFLYGLGLRGHLKVLPIQDCYKYMKLQHDATQVAVILGKCASHLGQMDRALTRLCCLHLPTFLPATDMEIPSPVQCAAVVGLGLNYVGSAQRRTVELLSAEIGKREQPDRPLPERVQNLERVNQELLHNSRAMAKDIATTTPVGKPRD